MSERDYLLSKDGLKLYYRAWLVDTPKAVLCIVHGLGEHSGRYKKVAAFFNDHDISVLAMDNRGHGKSEGKKGHGPDYQLLLSDVEELMKKARSEHTEAPMILMGHSMGGNFVGNFVMQENVNELAGFILSSAWIKLAFEPPQWKVNLARKVATVLPFLTQGNELNTAHLSRDEEEVRKYEEDPLVHDKISVRLFTDCLTNGIKLLESDKKLKIPGLVIHGTADHITDPKASEEFAEKHDNVEYVPIEGSYHETLNDLDREKVLDVLLHWIEAQSSDA